MTANESQVDGSHYRTASNRQHWDEMWELGEEAGVGWLWFYGAITKYLRRYRKKNGIRDLLKAKHFLEKLIELEVEKDARTRIPETGNANNGGPGGDPATDIHSWPKGSPAR